MDSAAPAIEWEQLLARYDDGSCLVAIVDFEFTLQAASTGAPAAFGVDPAVIPGLNAAELLHPSDLERALAAFTQTATFEGLRPPDVYRLRTNEGEFTPFDVSGENVEDCGGAVVFRLRPLDDRRRAEMLAVEQLEVLELLGSGAPVDDCLQTLTNMLERHVDGSAATVHLIESNGLLRPFHTDEMPRLIATRLHGCPVDSELSSLAPNLDEARQRGLSFFEHDLHDLPHWTQAAGLGWQSAVTTPCIDPTGRLVAFIEVLRSETRRPSNAELSVHALVARMVGLIIDRHSFEAALATAALDDALTGLGNRRRLTQVIDDLSDRDEPFSMIAVDLDQFTWINNNLGHQAGDQLLMQVSSRFVDALPPGALAFRPGGDEFVIVVPGERRQEAMIEVGRSLLDSLNDPIAFGTHQRKIRASFGVATCAEGDTDPTRILAKADAAMYAAKRDGGAGIRFFNADLGDRIMRRMKLADQLGAAIAGNELRLAFQPIVDLESMRLIGTEALVRWEHPALGLLAPDDFVPAAEGTSLILELDQWVATNAAAHFESWLADRPAGSPLETWINLSARTLERPDLLEVLPHGGRAKLGLEMTERDQFHHLEAAIASLRDLRQAGFHVSIDDFGTGLASLQRLTELDVSGLKIDRAFIHQMGESTRSRAVVESILSLGSRLDLTVTAEGIELERQLRTLRELGCERGQGFLMSRPLLPEALVTEFGPGLTDSHDLGPERKN